jgi:hypothetical protein
VLPNFDVGGLPSGYGHWAGTKGTNWDLDIFLEGGRALMEGVREVVKTEQTRTGVAFHGKEIQHVASLESTMTAQIWKFHCIGALRK